FFSSRRRHTRCLSDWSSDVCSSDLPIRPLLGESDTRPATPTQARDFLSEPGNSSPAQEMPKEKFVGIPSGCPCARPIQQMPARRSEERRVGKECRARWAAYRVRKSI